MRFRPQDKTYVDRDLNALVEKGLVTSWFTDRTPTVIYFVAVGRKTYVFNHLEIKAFLLGAKVGQAT